MAGSRHHITRAWSLSFYLVALLPQMFAIFLGNEYTYGGKHGPLEPQNLSGV